MRKTWIIIMAMLLFLFSGAIQLPAPQQDHHDECEEEGGMWVCVKPWQIVCEKSDLEAIRDQILQMQAEIARTYAMIDAKDAEIIQKNAEIARLEQKVTNWENNYKRDTKGIWLGARTGYPFGVLGDFGYQFNERFQINSSIGYMGQFQWQAGFSTRIGQ